MSEWNELCLPQYVKMFDPTSQNNKENEEEDIDAEESEDDDSNRKHKEEVEQNYERDKAKYKSEVKFHYLITGTGELGRPLPKIMELKNPYPGEPRFLKKRRHPKSLRLYKVKRDLNPERFFLHELMMYKSFGPDEYEKWHDDKNCLQDYEKFKDSIQKVKSQVMEWIEDVEEARYYVEEVLKNDVNLEETGESLDPGMEQEEIDCDIEGIEEDEKFSHLDPEGLKDVDFPDSGNWYRKLELLDTTILESETHNLDRWQRKVLDNGIKFARELKKYANGSNIVPTPENLIVIGGAGAGKSTVIQCLSQWCHRILAASGDDPNSPYILKPATTGAAATINEGSTVHSLLGFDFSSKHSSLTDKKREQKREQLKNLRILIIDEFSMMKADTLYRIHLRLMEVKQTPRRISHRVVP